MLIIDIPGYKEIRLEHLVLDYNGTLACDGDLISGVVERLMGLSDRLNIHVITADTFGTVASRLEDLPCSVTVLAKTDQDQGKLDFVRTLGAERTACIGNGRNDRLMLEAAALGIAVVEGEGCATVSLTAADIVCHGILSALDLLANSLRLTATLRS
ncbi:MAG: ATPase P [Syntrophaceae bacterium]|nr:ATPase P [Syntrophaceae bacterium]